jgi:tetratricopeptide (TPR) repeat protein
MWSFISRLGALILLASLAQPLPRALAQRVQQAAPTEQDKGTELAQLYERWQQTPDPEEKIVLAEQALVLEPTVKTWPLAAPREKVKGALLFGLGYEYYTRRQGSRADNLEQAIKADEAALTVFTREAFPRGWGTTQSNLGVALADRIRGDRADNLEQAIKAYEAALTVRTREAFPQDWAQTQNNLGDALRQRIRGDRADNLEQAIKADNAALTIYTREASPIEWARLQNNLAWALADRIRGDRADNLEQAIKA